MGIIETRNLSKTYGRRVGIADVDLSVDAGRLFGFLGPNGAGKTTTIRILLGFMRPTSGYANVLGHDCWRASHVVKRDVGYLPGDLRLYSWMNAWSALRFVGGARGMDLTAEGRVLIERFKLDPDVRVRAMSRGMRQKLGIIMTLAPRPRVLVLDEPTSGLDPIMQLELGDLLRERAADGTTVFFSSHTLSEVEQICDEIAIVRDGTIVADESIDALRARAARDVIVTFGTEPGALKPPAELTVVSRNGRRWDCELKGDAGPVLAWLSAHGVTDVSISPPNLESLFHRYYRGSEAGVS